MLGIRKRSDQDAAGEEGTMPQRVLITAGAAGIGREFARAFAASGARFSSATSTPALDAMAKEIPGLIAQPCDMHAAPRSSAWCRTPLRSSAGSTC